jgi:hypothetical protein
MRIAVVVLLLGALGCSGATTSANIDPTKDRLSKIARVYLTSETELKRPPQNIDDLKPIADKRGFGDEIWKSENDGQPFVIVWGVDIKKPGAVPAILAHEKEGRGGRKWAVDVMLSPHHMTDEELNLAKGKP